MIKIHGLNIYFAANGSFDGLLNEFSSSLVVTSSSVDMPELSLPVFCFLLNFLPFCLHSAPESCQPLFSFLNLMTSPAYGRSMFRLETDYFWCGGCNQRNWILASPHSVPTGLPENPLVSLKPSYSWVMVTSESLWPRGARQHDEVEPDLLHQVSMVV